MATYKQYSNTKGTLWEVKGYLGLDDETGKKIKFTKRGFKTKKQAVDYFKQESRKFDSGLSLQNKNSITVTQLYHEWLEQYSIDIEKSTLNKTTNIFENHILPPLGNKQIAHLKSSTIQRLINDWYKHYVSYKKMYMYLKNLINYAILQGYLVVNPCNKVKVPKAKKIEKEFSNRDANFYTKEQLEQVLSLLKSKAPLKWFCFFRLLAYSGLRRGEALALQWQDINFKKGTISVSRALKRQKTGLYIGNTKNLSSVRTLDMDNKTLDILKEWKVYQQEYFLKRGYNLLTSDSFVFRREDSNFPIGDATPRNFFYKFCCNNNFPFINVHGFRHTHCSLLFEAGVSMKDVKDRLGHNDIQTTMNIYAHVTPHSRKEASQKFAKYMEM
ncbi:tyrosine-type recombinase/integrase [Aerococcus christensenii]|uniref:tyrosine-type recombinase/integrase n=1 Tax=Aerococcus christensenii TaxID=87541 RepID=UPI003F42B39E